MREVLIGAKNLEMVEVLEGLNIGDVVVIETPHLLREGQRVKSILIKNKI